MAISIVFIALGAWFLYNHNMNFWPAGGRWYMGHHGMMGGGMGIIMVLFWILIIGTLILLISALVNGIGRSKQDRDEASEPRKKKGLWAQYLDRLNKATGGKPPSCCN